MGVRGKFNLLVATLIASVACACFAAGNDQPWVFETVSAQEVSQIWGGDFCYTIVETEICSQACGTELTFVTSVTKDGGWQAKGGSCNNSSGQSCIKPNLKGGVCALQE